MSTKGHKSETEKKNERGRERERERDTKKQSENQFKCVTITSGKGSDKQVQPKVNLTLLDHTVSGNQKNICKTQMRKRNVEPNNAKQCL